VSATGGVWLGRRGWLSRAGQARQAKSAPLHRPRLYAPLGPEQLPNDGT